MRRVRSRILALALFGLSGACGVTENQGLVAEKARSKAGIEGDGHALVDAAFGKGQGIPLLAFNSLQTESERSEHQGLMSLMKGTFSAFRNPGAHEPKMKWEVTEQDALELMALVSMLHRRPDKAVRTC